MSPGISCSSHSSREASSAARSSTRSCVRDVCSVRACVLGLDSLCIQRRGAACTAILALSPEGSSAIPLPCTPPCAAPPHARPLPATHLVHSQHGHAARLCMLPPRAPDLQVCCAVVPAALHMCLNARVGVVDAAQHVRLYSARCGVMRTEGCYGDAQLEGPVHRGDCLAQKHGGQRVMPSHAPARAHLAHTHRSTGGPAALIQDIRDYSCYVATKAAAGGSAMHGAAAAAAAQTQQTRAWSAPPGARRPPRPGMMPLMQHKIDRLTLSTQ